MSFLQKDEVCLLFSAPGVNCSPFPKVVNAPHIQRDQFTTIQCHLNANQPYVTGNAEDYQNRKTKKIIINNDNEINSTPSEIKISRINRAYSV